MKQARHAVRVDTWPAMGYVNVNGKTDYGGPGRVKMFQKIDYGISNM